ncbi:MAG: sulfatase-like hydrolase/transferase [Marinoscillum sp.]|uniref:sulfatase-like hydrolase/transferase n=3 Tax=Marinoscillum sp. TaxID=2024838 RepID=UPI0032F5CD7B
MKRWILCVVTMLLQYSIVAQSRPNMLWVVIEDTSPEYIGCYGNEVVNTPHIDSLASIGVRFRNAYSTGTVCSPSRSAIITGVKTYKTGTGDHRSSAPLPDQIRGFPAWLRESGYYTSNNSKTDYNTSSANRLIRESWNESSNAAGWWNRAPGQPFFSVFNFGASHQSRTMTNPYDLYQKQVLDQLPDHLKVADDDFEMPPYYKDSPEMRKQMARVYNGVSLADYEIGMVLDRLKADGLTDSTIVFFYADHGEGMPGIKTNGSGQGYRVPFVISVPEMYGHLSPWGAGTVTDQMVSFVDLAPTLLSLAEVTIPDYLDGRAFMGVDTSSEPTYLFVSNDRAEGSPSLDRAVIDGSWIYIRSFMPYSHPMRWIHYIMYGEISQQMYRDFNTGQLDDAQAQMLQPRPYEALFNLREDPYEQFNLVSQHPERVIRMRSALLAHMVDERDVHLVPEMDLKKLSDHISPYELRKSDTINWSLLVEVAALSGLQDNDAVQQQLAYLSHQNPWVRYWAAIGLKAQKNLSWKQIKQIRDYRTDTCLPVQVYLEGILHDHGDESAVQYFIEALSSEDQERVKLSLHLLQYSRHKEDLLSEVKDLFEKASSRRGWSAIKQGADVLIYRITGEPLHMETFW